MSTGLKMFGSPPTSGFVGGGFSTPPAHQHQLSTTAIGSLLVSPNSSGLGMGAVSIAPGSAPVASGSPIFQSPTVHKFPPGGGAIVFNPTNNPSPVSGGLSMMAPTSPYTYIGGSASSFIQSPPQAYGVPGHAYPPPQLSSTLSTSPQNQGVQHNVHHVASPLAHGYGHGQPVQYTNVQPYGYGARVMSGSYGFQQHNPYQHQHAHQMPVYAGYAHGPHSLSPGTSRQEVLEPMHCSPVGQATNLQPNLMNSPLYQHQVNQNQQQVLRSRSPPRVPYAPAYFTGIDVVAAVAPRPRRVFDRSPSTSPPVAGTTGRSPQKSPSWCQQEGTGQQPASSSGFGGQADGAVPISSGAFSKRAQGQGPNRQLRFNESHLQASQTNDEKDKKKSGPPIRGFGSSEEVTSFLNSPLLKEGTEIVPGAAIAQEAVVKAGVNSPIAESNWITVFGFPAAAASFIYTHFSQYGSILQSKCNPGGNWLHVQYSSRIDARKALACNGKVLGGTIMVGVISSPREVIEMYEKSPVPRHENSNPPPTSSNKPPTVKSPLQDRNYTGMPPPETSQIRGIRSLAGGGHLTSPILGVDRTSGSTTNRDSSTAGKENVQAGNVPLPTPSTGIITKAMEYMFGW